MNGKKAKFTVILIGAVFLVAVFLFFWYPGTEEQLIAEKQGEIIGEEIATNDTNMAEDVVEEEEQKEEFSESEMERYYAVYRDPFVIHVRKALNGYLAGTNEGMDMPEVVIEKSEEDGTIRGLSAFDESYYKSKFVVLSITDALFGGKDIILIFQDKPDKVFQAWVYKTSGEKGKEDGYYDLRGFWENTEASSKIDIILEEFGEQIYDQEHSL